MIPRNLIVSATTLLVLANTTLARPEFFARPVAQYTVLPSSSRNSEIYHSSRVSNYLGPSNLPPLMVATDYTASSGGFGGGISIGIIQGSERSHEIGAEGIISKFKGTYHVYRDNAATASTGMPPLTTHGCSFSVRTAMATYRKFFGKKADRLRPYIGCALGRTFVEVSEDYQQRGINYDDSTGESDRMIAGLSIGASYRLGKKTYLEAGYRFSYSDDAAIFNRSDDSQFFRNAHSLNLALSQRF